MKNAKKIGRPATYTGNMKKHIVGLIRQSNASLARNILNATDKNPLAAKRNLTLVPQPLGISMPTMLKFAKEAGLELHRGRPTADSKVAKIVAATKAA